MTAERIEPGVEVDGFRVEERIHAGGMALIYRVSRAGEPGPLVMKVPRLGPGEPATSVISYEVEQTLLSALHGPHVPRLVASGESNESGLVELGGALPTLERGQGLLVVSVQHTRGNDEVKFLINH